MFTLFPDLDEDLMLNLFHKGAKNVWTSHDDWDEDIRLDQRQQHALARVLSPVYLGEQSAMLGAAAILPKLAEAGESTTQVYLCSFIYDEARHFEALTHLYHRMTEAPIAIRDMPDMLRYHNRLRQGDRADWVWGILISDLFAKNFYQAFAKVQPDALFGRMSARILQDESRHQAFATEYLRRTIPQMAPERRAALVKMRDDLMRIMESMYRRLNDDAAALGIDGSLFLQKLFADIESSCRRIGLTDPDGGPGGGRRVQAPAIDLQSARAQVQRRRLPPAPQLAAAEPSPCGDACDTCYLAALCSSRLVRKAVAR
jgi:hypothetical protein